jgi:hypothetical protein
MLPAPESTSALVDQAIVLGRRHFLPLVRLGIVPLLAANWAGYHSSFSGGVASGGGALFWASAYLLYGLSEAAMIAGAWELLHGRSADSLHIWSLVGRRAVPIAIGYLIKSVMVTLGILAVIIPGFYLLALYFAIPAVTVIEGVGIRASFAHSRTLARGAMLRILLSIGLVWVLAAVVGVVIQQGLPLAGVLRGSPLVYLLVVLWGVLIAPVRAALTTLVYLDLRVRKEGYDLQVAMSSLPGVG